MPARDLDREYAAYPKRIAMLPCWPHGVPDLDHELTIGRLVLVLQREAQAQGAFVSIDGPSGPQHLPADADDRDEPPADPRPDFLWDCWLVSVAAYDVPYMPRYHQRLGVALAEALLMLVHGTPYVGWMQGGAYNEYFPPPTNTPIERS